MKKELLAVSLFLPSLLFSYDLEFSKSFSKNIENDRLQTNISININSMNTNFINNKMEVFQDFIDLDKSVIKKNGRYNVIPRYRYKDSKQIFDGYKGTLSYTIQSRKHEVLNSFISELDNIKQNMNHQQIKLSISNLHWIVSKELYENNIDTMRIESIKWIKSYTQRLNDNCMIKSIEINKNSNYRTPRYSKNVMLESSKSFDVSPTKTEQLIVLNTNYKLQCK